MKEFAMKHPFLTFFMVDSAIGGVVSIVKAVVGLFNKGDKTEVTISPAPVVEEETQDEPSGDIQ